MARKYKSGNVVAGWTLETFLGRGGSGEVWQAARGPEVVALKILTAPKADRKKRFSGEVEVAAILKGVPGILPVLDSDVSSSPPWIALPLARPIKEALGIDPAVEEVVAAVRDIARALSVAAVRDVSHRDIKPDNLFRLGEQFVVGDFGIASYPDKEELTKPGEKVGPLWYIAPEMLNNATNAVGFSADVYSLAKTLWVLLTGQRFPLPGHHVAGVPAFSLSSYVVGERLQLLDSLLDRGTQIDPSDRPSMATVCDELNAWLGYRKGETAPMGIEDLVERIKNATRVEQAEIQRKTENEASANRTHLRIVEAMRELHESVRDLGPAVKTNQGHDATGCFDDRQLQEPGYPRGGSEIQVRLTSDARSLVMRCGIGVHEAANGDLVLTSMHHLIVPTDGPAVDGRRFRLECEAQEEVRGIPGSSVLEADVEKLLKRFRTRFEDTLAEFARRLDES
jgi:serine/threonine protein kinase